MSTLIIYFHAPTVSNFDIYIGWLLFYDPLVFFVNHRDTYMIIYTRDFEVHMAYDISCCLHARDELSNYIYHKILSNYIYHKIITNFSYHCISF